MTGAYLRVQREGKWKNIEVENLTDEERKERFQNSSNKELISWFQLVCHKLAEVEPLFLELERDGIIKRRGSI